jgi:hypothetical protein
MADDRIEPGEQITTIDLFPGDNIIVKKKKKKKKKNNPRGHEGAFSPSLAVKLAGGGARETRANSRMYSDKVKKRKKPLKHSGNFFYPLGPSKGLWWWWGKGNRNACLVLHTHTHTHSLSLSLSLSVGDLSLLARALFGHSFRRLMVLERVLQWHAICVLCLVCLSVSVSIAESSPHQLMVGKGTYDFFFFFRAPRSTAWPILAGQRLQITRSRPRS